MRKNILVGISDYSLQVAQWICDSAKIKGEQEPDISFLAQNYSSETQFRGYSILDKIESYNVHNDDVLVCALCFPWEKEKYLTPLFKQAATFINVIHPSATIAASAVIGQGNVIFPNATISANAYVSNFVTVLFSGMGHDTYAGDFVTIGSQCDITGGVKIHRGANIEDGAIIIPHKVIGENAIVRKGSIVVRNVRPNVTVSGNPAHIIKKL